MDLFRAVEAVESEAASERRRASRIALARLFVRISGDTEVLNNYPKLRESLPSAERYISSFHYRSAAEEALDDVPLWLHLQFHADSITALLRRAGAPYWQVNRPAVLLWLATQEDGQRQLASAENAPQHYALLQRAAAARGLPLISPLLDLDEISQLSADQVWQLSVEPVLALAPRYDADAVLVGKLAQRYDKRWLGQWLLLYQGRQQLLHYEGEQVEEYFALGVNLVADRLARDYAVVATDRQHSAELKLTVEAVDSQRDYVALRDYLAKISAVEALQLVRLDGDRCDFYFQSSSDLAKIRSLLELDKRLLWLGRPGVGGLHYRWRGEHFSDNP